MYLIHLDLDPIHQPKIISYKDNQSYDATKYENKA